MDVGTELREARQRAGMSREQLSQRTNIPVAEIEALEQNAFDRLVGGFYLDRIVRAYAHEVGLDDSSRLVEQARAAHHMAAASASEMAHPLDLAPTDDDAVAAFPAESALLPLESARPSLESTLPSLQSTLPSSESTLPSFESAQLSSAASTTAPGHGPRSGNAILPVALIAAFLGGAALGAFVMYRSETKDAAGTVSSRPASTRDSRELERTLGVGTTGPASRDSSTGKSAATPAKPADSAAPVTVAPSAATPDAPAARPAADPGPAERATPPPPPRATATLPAPAGIPATPPPEPRAEADLSSTPASDLSGEWTLNTVVESSSLSAYEGLRLGYRLQLEQRGVAVRGSGQKVLENGKAISGAGQTPITVEGTIDGDRLRMTFTERGAQRASSGTFVLFREGTDGLRGRFTSDAARSAGRVEARRR